MAPGPSSEIEGQQRTHVAVWELHRQTLRGRSWSTAPERSLRFGTIWSRDTGPGSPVLSLGCCCNQVPRLAASPPAAEEGLGPSWPSGHDLTLTIDSPGPALMDLQARSGKQDKPMETSHVMLTFAKNLSVCCFESCSHERKLGLGRAESLTPVTGEGVMEAVIQPGLRHPVWSAPLG